MPPEGDNQNQQQQGQQGQQQGQQGQQQGQQQQQVTFESWLEGQGQDVQGLINGHIAGLRSALQSERDQRRQFERELREAAGQLEQGSEARQRLDQLTADLDVQERRAEFYEAAHQAGIVNLRLAWLAVQQDDEVRDRRGNANMAGLRERYPELFGHPAPAGNAGSGTNQQQQPAADMNAFIRTAAGRPPAG